MSYNLNDLVHAIICSNVRSTWSSNAQDDCRQRYNNLSISDWTWAIMVWWIHYGTLGEYYDIWVKYDIYIYRIDITIIC